VRASGDVDAEKAVLRGLTVKDVMKATGNDLTQPMKKLSMMHETGNTGMIKSWAKMWMDTHPQDYRDKLK
ncbi:hypothetical protein ACFLRF_05985, partial [Candidatus Altiarchaeota archaeon]